MMSTTPFSQENYSGLIIGVIVRYYQRCHSHFRDTVMNDTSSATKVPLAPLLSQREDLMPLLDELARTEDPVKRNELSQAETTLELEATGSRGIDKKELLGTKERFEALSSLCFSLVGDDLQ